MAEATNAFLELYRYNAWANARVFGVCCDVELGILQATAPGTAGSIEDTLKHMMGVEDVYLLMLQDQPLESPEGRDQYFAHDLIWFSERAARVGEEYLALLPRLDDAALAAPLRVPWFDFPLTKRDGLHQVLSHSAQHRAQVFSALGARGLEVPSLDYVMMVAEQQKKRGA